MDDNKRTPYDDFINGREDRDGSGQQPGAGRNPASGSEPQAPHYYSYGPYKSNEQDQSLNPYGHGDPVEITPPRPVPPIPGQPVRQQPAVNWTAGQKRRGSGLRGTLATILATAVAVGGLMFAADTTNLFTGDKPMANSNVTGAPAAGSGTNGAAPGKSVSLDIARPNNIAQIVQNSSPAVVKIETLVKPRSTGGGGNSLFNDPFFRQFFGDDFFGGGGGGGVEQPNTEEPQPAGIGSGFLFEKDGYILTNQHVVEGADQIRVWVLGHEKPFEAELLGNSFDLDLAVLKIKGDKDFPVLPLAQTTDTMNVGDWVVAIGNPHGFDHTVTVGVLSAKERSIEIPEGNKVRKYKHLMQTDASINPGNSGGPLLNLNGEVIGINTAVSAQAQGIGFAVPINTIQEVVDKLKKNVEIPKEPAPFVGVRVADIPKQYVRDLQLKSTDGAIVDSVTMGSPAFKAGIKAYDVIVSFNGTPIKNKEELVKRIQESKVGDKITLGVVRDGNNIEVPVTVGDVNQQAQNEQE